MTGVPLDQGGGGARCLIAHPREGGGHVGCRHPRCPKPYFPRNHNLQPPSTDSSPPIRAGGTMLSLLKTFGTLTSGTGGRVIPSDPGETQLPLPWPPSPARSFTPTPQGGGQTPGSLHRQGPVTSRSLPLPARPKLQDQPNTKHARPAWGWA